jgi:hypothetical protein
MKLGKALATGFAEDVEVTAEDTAGVPDMYEVPQETVAEAAEPRQVVEVSAR